LRPSERRRTALKAAYFIGPGARSVYIAAASHRSNIVRRDAAYQVYLQWFRDPSFVYSLMQSLSHHLSLVPLGRSRRILSFLADLSITIYINHPERADVLQQVGDLWRSILQRRLRMPILAPILTPLLTPIVSTAFSERIMRTALLDELQDPRRFFASSAEERSRFSRVAALCEPDDEIDGKEVEADLAALFGSDVMLHTILAALVVAIHSSADLKMTEPLVRRLWQRLDGHGRLWLLQAFSVPLPETPKAWLPLLEDLTGELIANDRGTFLTNDGGRLQGFDIALLPLGLAYGKSGTPMTLIGNLLGAGGATAAPDLDVTRRVIRGLASIGIFYPGPVLQILGPLTGGSMDSIQTDLAVTLGTIRVLHLDLVDVHLLETEAPAAFRDAVAREAQFERARPYVTWIGIYNNAVHEALHYPDMRRQLLIAGLRHLAEARTPAEFVRRYSPIPFRMLRESDYDPLAWTAA
jgi:hypothetical protein